MLQKKNCLNSSDADCSCHEILEKKGLLVGELLETDGIQVDGPVSFLLTCLLLDPTRRKRKENKAKKCKRT